MYQLLTLLDDPLLHRQIHAGLSSSYVLLAADQTNPFGQVFDVCLIDEIELQRRHAAAAARKQAEFPVLLPFLLITTRESIHSRQWQQWYPIDDFITLPLDLAELQTRLTLLLRNRRSSLAVNAERQQTQVFLQRNEKQFGGIARNLPVMLNAWDKSNTFVFWNHECERVTGYRADEIVDNPRALELLYPDSAYREKMVTEWMSRQGAYRDWEWTLMTRDGQARTIAWSSLAAQFPIFEWAAWGVGMDVTERNHARAMADALRDTAAALTSTLHLTDVFERILANVGLVVPHDAANIMLLDETDVHIVRSHGYDTVGRDQMANSWRVKLADTIYLRQMQQTRQPIIIPDVQVLASKPPSLSLTPLHSYVGAPICLNDEVIGFINLHNLTRDFFTPVDADHLQAFAESAAIAIQNARLYEQAHLLAAYEERQRLARDLHDAVTQSLFSASIITEALPRQFETHPETVKERLHTLHRLMRGALAETRTLLLELRPNDMIRMDIGPLLTQLIEGVQSRKKILVETEIENQPEFDLNVKKAFYRITQEALNNVLKHAQATHARVVLLRHDYQYHLTITDNGRGFDTSQVAPASMGLEIMRERAQAIGGALTIHSQPGQGTEVKMIWPVNEEGQGL